MGFTSVRSWELTGSIFRLKTSCQIHRFIRAAAYSQAQMQRENMDGMNMNPRATVQSVREFKRFCANNKTIFLPCHDPESARRLEQLEFVRV
jgi:hypothetical protein